MFWALTILTIACVLYCVDEPIIWDGFSLLINNHNSMLYGVSLSVIATYIFFVIQTWIPQKKQERKAYVVLEKKLKRYIDNSYWIMVFCESLCDINRENNTIRVVSPYARWNKNGRESKFIVKIDICMSAKGNRKLKNLITGSGYYMQLEQKKLSAFQKLIDNDFLCHFNRHVNTASQINYVELMKEYDEFKKSVNEVRKVFGIKDTISLTEYSDKDRIAEFELKNSSFKKAEDGLNAILFMKTED